MNDDLSVLEGLDFDPDPATCECPGCYAHRGPCRNTAVWTMLLHDIHGCDKPDLDPDGNALRLACEPCRFWHAQRVLELSTKVKLHALHTGFVVSCQVCQRPLDNTDAYLLVEPYPPPPGDDDAQGG